MSRNTLSFLFLLATFLSLVDGTPHSVTSSNITQRIATKKDAIEVAINKTKDVIQGNLNTINNITNTRANLSKRAKIAFNDCLELGEETLERLNIVIQDLRAYNYTHQHVDNLLTFMSSTITNTETCLDGFSHDEPCKFVRKLINKGQENGGKMCSNALSMIKNLTVTEMAKEPQFKEKVSMWPDWLSVGDRKLLQSEAVIPNSTVAADGTGDYTTVREAVAAAPSKSVSRYVIKIKTGVYMENVAVPRSKPNIMFIGEGRSKSIISGSLSVAGGTTTFSSATVAAVGDGFLARDITFQNTAGPSGNQAVALRVGSDLSAFYRCDMQAYQDTLYVHSNRQFYVECTVQGTVDFIFGNAAVVFQDCNIQARVPNPEQKNMVTAQGRSDPNQNTGIVIQKCSIGATSELQPVQATHPTYLGRPWKEYSRTIVMQSSITDVINPAGWYLWNGDFALGTLYYREYQNTGLGSDTSNRVTWNGWGVITNSTEADTFTSRTFIGGDNWLPSTTFPFSLGL